jgi:hypothetical protein
MSRSKSEVGGAYLEWEVSIDVSARAFGKDLRNYRI